MALISLKLILSRSKPFLSRGLNVRSKNTVYTFSLKKKSCKERNRRSLYAPESEILNCTGSLIINRVKNNWSHWILHSVCGERIFYDRLWCCKTHVEWCVWGFYSCVKKKYSKKCGSRWNAFFFTLNLTFEMRFLSQISRD